MARIVGKPSADDVKRVAVAALVAALDDGKDQAKKKPGLTGMRAVATGAVLYTAGKAAYNGRRFINERLEARPDHEEDGEDFDDEDFEDDEELEEEPVSEEDDDFEEDDEDFEEDEEDEERSAASEPPVHPDEDDDDEIDDADLPERPSRSRAPVGRR
jgi:hypothetical protein